LLLPLQLNDRFRLSYPSFHRRAGYLLMFLVPVITAGAHNILKKKLTFEQSFPDLLGVTQGFSELGLSPFPDSIYALHVLYFWLAAWFMATAIVALRYAFLHQYNLHKTWIARHVASGLIVAVQRIYVIIRRAHQPAAQRAAFYDGAVVATIFNLVIAELYIFFRNRHGKMKLS
jgi:hypothetical protein